LACFVNSFFEVPQSSSGLPSPCCGKAAMERSAVCMTVLAAPSSALFWRKHGTFRRIPLPPSDSQWLRLRSVLDPRAAGRPGGAGRASARPRCSVDAAMPGRTKVQHPAQTEPSQFGGQIGNCWSGALAAMQEATMPEPVRRASTPRLSGPHAPHLEDALSRRGRRSQGPAEVRHGSPRPMVSNAELLRSPCGLRRRAHLAYNPAG
jgi:hypothetical protein